MKKLLLWAGAAAMSLAAQAAIAEPVKLKLAMFSADTEMTWVTVIKPWADQVNAAGKGVVEIDQFPNGALGKALPEQSQIVLDGVADIAFVIPGVTPGRFPENEVMDLPGLFKDEREATLVYTAIMKKRLMKSFDKYVVIGAMGTPPFEVDSRTKVTSLADLKGKKIRVTNASQSATMKALGAVPVLMPVNEIPEAVGRGTIDGATEFPGPMYDFGVDRVTKYDYFLPVGISSLTILMNRAKFESLPQEARDVLTKYSGDWVAQTFIKDYGHYIDTLRTRMTADTNRVVTVPSAEDQAAAQAPFQQVIDDWVKKSPGNAGLLTAVRDEIAAVRK